MAHFTRATSRSFKHFTFTYVTSVFYVVAICYFFSHLTIEQSYMIPLFALEWLIIMGAFYGLCPSLGLKRGTLFGGTIFVLVHFVVFITLPEMKAYYGAVHAGSDDYWYLLRAADVAKAIRLSGGNLYEGWLAYYNVTLGDWSLGAWPFFLGAVSSLFAKGFEDFHPIALSLNAMFLSLTLALLFHFLEKIAQYCPWVFGGFFLALSGDPFAYAAMSRKEAFLQFVLVLSFVSAYRVVQGRNLWFWVPLLGIGFACVLGSRTAYVVLLAVFLYLAFCDKYNIGLWPTFFWGVILSFLLYGPLVVFEIRGVTWGKKSIMEAAQFSTGLGVGSQIYRIPVVGPIIFYVLAPIPSNPFDFNKTLYFQQLVRGVGSLLYTSSFGYVVLNVMKRLCRRISRDYMAIGLSFVILFAAAVIISDDPRYKQPTNYFLALMAFLTWFNKRIHFYGGDADFLVAPPLSQTDRKDATIQN